MFNKDEFYKTMTGYLDLYSFRSISILEIIGAMEIQAYLNFDEDGVDLRISLVRNIDNKFILLFHSSCSDTWFAIDWTLDIEDFNYIVKTLRSYKLGHIKFIDNIFDFVLEKTNDHYFSNKYKLL